MSRGAWEDYGPLRGFYRDRENGWIFGVCAGIADRFNFNIVAVRVLAVVSLLLFSWLTLILYVIATLVIREKPLIYSGRDTEYDFWRHRRCDTGRH